MPADFPADIPVLESLTFDGWFNRLRSRVDFDTPRGPTPGRIDTDGYGPGFSVARFSGIIDTVFFNVTVPIDWETTWSMKVCRVRSLGSGEEAESKSRRVGEALVRDLRRQMASNVIVRQHDIATEPLLREHFDVVHARAVLQHVPTRDEVVTKLVDSLKPGGRLVIEDGTFLGFGQQALPEPYQTIHRIMSEGSLDERRDPNFGLRALDLMRSVGLVDLDVQGDVWAMRPHEPSGEWWFLALERAMPIMVGAGVVTEADGKIALEQVRSEGFVILSPTSIATMGRKPL